MMAEQEHPRYPNPQIQEALCEIHFELPSGRAWESSFAGSFYKEIKDEFPDLTPVQGMGFHVQIGPEGLTQSLRPQKQLIRYTKPESNVLLQLSEDMFFTINILAPYPGWDCMKDYIATYWELVKKVIEPSKATRLGIRYINRVAKTESEQSPSVWFKPSDFISKAVLDSAPGFLSRQEIKKTDFKGLNVSLADDGESIVFDLECIVVKDLEVDAGYIIDKLVELRSDIWTVFSTSITSEYQMLLGTPSSSTGVKPL